MIERLLLLMFVIIAAIRWIYVRRRFRQLEQRIDALTRPAPPGPAAEPDLARRDRKETARRDEPSPPTDWEAEVGANWLNKVGMFVLVIGMALALGYSFRLLGPLGRVAISAAAGFAMIAAGIVIERRDRYRTFGRGLIGGGWATLYFTAYAMHAVDAARVIENPVAAAFLLTIVAAGMIVQSLRYRSEAVTGLAYFIAFVTLAITEATILSLAALVPLAASLLYVSRRFSRSRFALLGLIATYLTCAFRGETGAPLWQAQSIFAIYWLLFEGFDIFSRSNWLLPLNAAGFAGLSLIKWALAAPDRIWQFLAAAAAAYLASAALRGRAGRGPEAAAIGAALAAAAVFLKLDNQWRALALLTEAELVYLAGLRLRVPLLRYTAGAVFALEAGHLLLWERTGTWTSIAVLSAAIFYLNRFLAISDFVFGYAGAGMLALVVYHQAPIDRLGLYWILLAAGPLAIGWMRRLADFRFQSYTLAGLGLCGMLWHRPEPSFSLLYRGGRVLYGNIRRLETRSLPRLGGRPGPLFGIIPRGGISGGVSRPRGRGEYAYSGLGRGGTGAVGRGISATRPFRPVLRSAPLAYLHSQAIPVRLELPRHAAADPVVYRTRVDSRRRVVALYAISRADPAVSLKLRVCQRPRDVAI